MKFINKYLLMSFLILSGMNIKANGDGDTTTSKSWCLSTDRRNVCKLGHVATQLATIHSLDTTNAKLVRGLAIVRAMFNAITVTTNLNNILAEGALQKSDLVNIASLYVHGKNGCKDVSYIKDPAKVASLNERRKDDKALQQQKLCQTAWLIVNQALPYMKNRFKLSELPFGNLLTNKWVLEISELLRQNMRYKMMRNKQKAA